MKRAVFFDVDGTIVQCQTQDILARCMQQQSMFSFVDMVNIFFWFSLYKMGWVRRSEKIRRRSYAVFSRFPQAKMDTLFQEVADKIARSSTRPIMRNIIEKHKYEGDLIFALSGSLENLSAPICQYVEITNIFATKLIIKDGRYSGLWKGNILEGEEKAKKAWLLGREYGFQLCESVAYADSFTDLPLLKAVGHPVVVNPDPRLRKYAVQKKWPILEA